MEDYGEDKVREDREREERIREDRAREIIRMENSHLEEERSRGESTSHLKVGIDPNEI